MQPISMVQLTAALILQVSNDVYLYSFWLSTLKPIPCNDYRDLPVYTAIPYRAITGPEQGFPCVLFPHREKPVFITGMGFYCSNSTL